MKKLSMVGLVLLALAFAVGRWEGKRAADKYYAERPVSDLDKYAHIIKGYRITGGAGCAQVGGEKLFMMDEIEDWNEGPCVLSGFPEKSESVAQQGH